MKKTLVFCCLLLCLMAVLAPSMPVNAVSGSDWRAGRIMDDAIFMDKGAMSAQQIQEFLNSKVPACQTNHSEDPYWRDMGPPYICLKDYREDPSIPIRDCTQGEVAAYFGFGPEDSRYTTALGYCWWLDGRANLKGQAVGPGAQSAAQIIWQAAQDYNISPKVLLVTLQKEQSLITDTWPWVGNYQKAMGYACPDSGTCNPNKRGFYQQVRNAAWQFRRYIDYPQSYNFAVGNRYIGYHPNTGCGGTVVNIETAASAALYNYTPYQPNAAALANLYGLGDGCSSYGNRNFWRLFNDWFGPTLGPIDYSCKEGVNISSAPMGGHILGNKVSGTAENLTLAFPNKTASGCIEIHTWGPGQQSWISNVATNHPAIDPANSAIVAADTNGDGKDELSLILYRNTGSGKIEIHTWGPGQQSWISNVATNHPAI